MKRVLLATFGALVAATVVCVTIVLPAELGVDPTGIGRALGLTGLAESPPRAVRQTATAWRSDVRRFELAPFESAEFKYRLAAGDGLAYAWTASGEVVWDLHAEPEGAAPEVAESFAQGRGATDRGTYVAAFPGLHGWFWENRGARPVTVNLRASGFPTEAFHYAGGRADPVALAAPWPEGVAGTTGEGRGAPVAVESGVE